MLEAVFGENKVYRAVVWRRRGGGSTKEFESNCLIIQGSSSTWNGQCVKDREPRLLPKYLGKSRYNTPTECIRRCSEVGEGYANYNTIPCSTMYDILQGQQELSTESVYLTQPPRAILGMVGDGAMTLSTVYNFCFETNNYYQDKKIIYIVSRARVGDPLML